MSILSWHIHMTLTSYSCLEVQLLSGLGLFLNIYARQIQCIWDFICEFVTVSILCPYESWHISHDLAPKVRFSIQNWVWSSFYMQDRYARFYVNLLVSSFPFKSRHIALDLDLMFMLQSPVLVSVRVLFLSAYAWQVYKM